MYMGDVQMSNVKVEFKYSGINDKDILKYKSEVTNIIKELHKKADDEKEFVRMEETA